MKNINKNNNSENKKILIDFMEKYNSVKNGRSELWKYLDEIRELLENDYMIKHICHYLRFYRNVKLKEKTIYDFIYRNRDKILNTQTTEQTTQPVKEEKEEKPKQQPKPSTPQPKPATKPEQKQEQSKDKYEVKTEEENPLTYEEYLKDYDEAIEVLNPEQWKKTGFVFRKDAWKKLTKEEFKRAEWLLATKPIAYWQIDKQKGVYYKTIRNLKNECIEKGHDLRRYLAYLSSLKNRKDEDPVVNSLEFFIRKVMDYGRKK